DGATILGTRTLAGGSATLSTAALAGGPHSITVDYGGDATFAASTSPSLAQTINKASTSTTFASVIPNPSVLDQPVTFTATVTSSNGTPGGTVTFRDGGSPVGTVALTGGSATLTPASLAAGDHSITADYNGDATFAVSTSATLTQTVNLGTTTTIVSSSLN